MNFKKLIENSRNIYLEADFELINYIKSQSENFEEDLALLNSFDVKNVEPMFRIHEETREGLLREDNVSVEGFSQENAFKNVSQIKDDFVVINRVVGDQKKR